MGAEKSSDRRGSLGFEKQLWEAADLLRGNMDPSEYKHVVLGLLFLKYISDAFQERWDELARLVADPESDYYVDGEEREEELAVLREVVGCLVLSTLLRGQVGPTELFKEALHLPALGVAGPRRLGLLGYGMCYPEDGLHVDHVPCTVGLEGVPKGPDLAENLGVGLAIGA